MAISYPTVALQPGATGAAVKQLQDYLVSQGYMTQAQVNTGYGTYGPQTTAAVLALQQKLGVDNSTGPGYWGPRTLAKVQAQTTSPTPAPTPPPVNPPVPAQTPNQIAASRDTNTVPPQTQAAPNATPTAPTTGEYTKGSAYQSLSPDLKKLVDTAFSSYQGTPAQQQAFTDALNNAKTLADPYEKSQLALATAEFKLSIAKTTSDYQAQKNVLDTTIKNIQEDLSANKENLTLTEQADLATSLRNYRQQGLDLSDQAAEKGLTFATGEKSNERMQATNDAQYGDVVQSTQRQYNFNMQQLQLKADRGDADAKAQLDKLNADNSSTLSTIGVNAEKVLGSDNTAALNVPGYSPQGKGNLGSIAQDENASIIGIADKAINTQ